jgi:hypothetical protein
VEDV